MTPSTIVERDGVTYCADPEHTVGEWSKTLSKWRCMTCKRLCAEDLP